ncbi:MAG TPA: hypothetical protein VNM37_02705 [Candidatus Dormibacteraeota bacterium]|nr:hypothetical protein [Verrucomicrobiae bacterium]HXJ71728.1 hypothetical protein [Candidatus Dormibacteraeota bacterium]
MSGVRSVIATVAFGHSTEHLDYTFSSFARNQGVVLHAFILGENLPQQRLESITYHLVKPVPDFSHPLREVYFRRIALLDQLDADYALMVDSYDALCLQALPPFETILGGGDVAACVEHHGARYVLGQGYTANFLNGGVFFWNIARSRDIRHEIVERGRTHFRTVADDQYVINEVIQTRFYDRLRILPCQYNYRAYLNRRQRGWPTVTHLDGVLIYHNAACIDEAKRLGQVKPRADLPALPPDGHPLTQREQFWRRLRLRCAPHIIK